MASQTSDNPTNKRVIRPYEWILLIIALLIILYFLLERVGIDNVKRTEQVSWLDNPSGPEAPINRADQRNENIEKKVDGILTDIETQFAEGNKSYNNTTSRGLENLTTDEERYLAQRHDKETMSASDWIRLARKSLNTYRQIKAIFDKADGKTEHQVNEQEVESILSNLELKDIAFAALEKQFNISRSKLDAFEERGSKAVSDWAAFIETNQQ
jgi:hypothetical protein